jgi:hypothetical protein
MVNHDQRESQESMTMKKALTRLALSGALALSIAITAAPWAAPAAQAQTKFPTYTSGVQVQNLENSEALVTLTAYKADGSVDTTIGPDAISANGSKTYFPLGVTDGFQGSMVISSDKKVAAIANILSSDFAAGASYIAASAGANEVQLPLLMKDNSGFTTWYAVQNTGSAAANVSVEYSDGTSVASFSLPANAAKVIYQANETHNAAVFSAIITSDQPVVASVIEESSAIMFAYTGFTGGANNPVFPLINANNAGYQTGIQLQNAGNAATEVTVTYKPSSAGTECTETRTIQPGASANFALAAFANDNDAAENCAGGVKFVGSAKVTGNSGSQPLVAIINQLGPTNGEAYGSFNPDTATAKVVMPLIMDRNGGFFTGFNVQNVGTSPTSVSCSFTGTGYTVGPETLQPDQALTDVQGEKISAGYVGSGTCTASAGGKIVGVVNELGASKDQLLVYEAASAE